MVLREHPRSYVFRRNPSYRLVRDVNLLYPSERVVFVDKRAFLRETGSDRVFGVRGDAVSADRATVGLFFNLTGCLDQGSLARSVFCGIPRLFVHLAYWWRGADNLEVRD